MIPFHAFHLPMPQYQPPVDLDIDEKILGVLKILRGLHMTVMDPMLHSISHKASMLPWRETFFRSRALIQFLNVLDADEQASEQLRVILRPIAIKIVTDEVDAEMEAAKDIFGMSSKDITPELLLSFDLDALLTARL
ncbi:hypothetical protein BDR04DRAFT_1094665 [Suillus decipiens]|nr:hypothetical protein BDR04DRAFT_1094665 [Suillus decipiens]